MDDRVFCLESRHRQQIFLFSSAIRTAVEIYRPPTNQVHYKCRTSSTCNSTHNSRCLNESQHQDINDNVIRIVKLARSKDLVVKSTTFQHQNFHKYTWNCPGRNNHNLIDHILIDRRRSSILDVRSSRGADCDTVHCLVVEKFREILAACKRAAQNFHVERFNFRKLNQLEVRRQYKFKISKKFASSDK